MEAINFPGRPFEIPDCSRNELPEFFVQMGYRVGAEIGANTGQFTERLCRAGLRVYAVDPWASYEGYQHRAKDGQEDYEAARLEAVARLAPYDCEIVRATSMEAVGGFGNYSLDFVYIDANHSIRHGVDDIYEWNRKVRVGGVVSGHDYGTNRRGPYSPKAMQVKYAVDAMTMALGIINWYVIGEKEAPRGRPGRDLWRSWFWIKTARDDDA